MQLCKMPIHQIFMDILARQHQPLLRHLKRSSISWVCHNFLILGWSQGNRLLYKFQKNTQTNYSPVAFVILTLIFWWKRSICVLLLFFQQWAAKCVHIVLLNLKSTLNENEIKKKIFKIACISSSYQWKTFCRFLFVFRYVSKKISQIQHSNVCQFDSILPFKFSMFWLFLFQSDVINALFCSTLLSLVFIFCLNNALRLTTSNNVSTWK